MLVIKDISTGFLFSPVCIAAKWTMQVAVLHYFDLLSPDESLSEQELWPDVLPVLGEGGTLDAGYPKPRGEVLVAGTWYAPDNEPASGGRAAFGVGDIKREFLVFGPRYWTGGILGSHPTTAEPVKSVPLTWQSAYGGEGFAENPFGIGFTPVATPWEEKRRYLPQVEDPASGLVGAPDDVRLPACPRMCLFDTPSRMALAGTYTGDWLERYWPGFPPDVHKDFFQLAPPSQRLQSGWFAGGENVSIEGMHPRFPRIESRLPKMRARVFATRVSDKKQPEKQEFVEISTHAETVWLFPDLMRGVMLYRGVVDTVDDEMSDFVSLFPVLEKESAAPTDLHYWLEEQQKRTAKPEGPDPQALEDAKATVENIKFQIRTITEDAHAAVDRVMERAPIFDIPISDQYAKYRSVTKDALGTVDTVIQELKTARKQYSHVMKIDPHSFDGTKAALLETMQKLDDAEKQILDAHDKARASREEVKAATAEIKKQFEATGKQLNMGYTQEQIDAFDEVQKHFEPDPTWSSTALDLIARHIALVHNTEDPFHKLGLRQGCSAQSGFGLLREPLVFKPELWGSDGLASATLEPGYIIPWFLGKECVRIAIRKPLEASDDCPHPEDALMQPCEEQLIPGSSEGMQIIGGHTTKPLLVVEDPVTAWFYYAQVGDVFAIIIVTSPEAEVPELLAPIIEQAPAVFFPISPALLSPQGKDEQKDAFLQRASEHIGPYQSLFPALAALPWNEDFSAEHVAAAKRKGLDVRAWLMDALKERALPTPSFEEEGGIIAEYDENGAPVIKIAVPTLPHLHEDLHKRITDHVEERKAVILKESDDILDEANERLRSLGLKTVSKEEMNPPVSFDLPVKQIEEEMLRQKAILNELKQVEYFKETDLSSKIPLAEDLMDKALVEIKKAAGPTKDLEKMLADLHKNGPWLNIELPDWVWDVPGAAMILQPQAPSVDGMIEKLRKGESKGLSITEMDFSGQDLSGCVFSEVILNKVNFSNANLSGARFEQCIGEELDFTGADMTDAVCKMASFSKCVFNRTICYRLQLELSNISASTFSSLKTEGMTGKLTNLTDSVYSGIFREMNLELFTLSGTFQGAVFERCTFTKGTSLQSTIQGLSFRNSTLEEVGFVMCEGKGLSILESYAQNTRIIRSTIEDFDCMTSLLRRSSFRESTLLRARFDRCGMKGICIEHCEMPFAVFSTSMAPGGVIRHSNLEGAQMVRFSFPNGSFRRTNLVRADLTDANLFGADLYKAVLGESILTRTNLTKTLLHGAENILYKTGMAGRIQ